MARMTKLTRCIGAVIALASLVVSTGWADEPWGYLYELGARRVHPLRGESVKLGRLAQSDVILRDPRVSRRHAEIRRSVDGAVLLDLGSTNGTRKNGEKVLPGQEAALEPGDILILAYEKLIYHERKADLWEDALQHSLLASFVQLRAPVLSDRKVKNLGRERFVTAVSRATVDNENKTFEMSYPDDAVRQLEFQPEELAFVGEVSVTEGELRLSLWGLAREGSLVSRRASMSRLKHGELRVNLAANTTRDARMRFETGWADNGIHFLFPLLAAVLESYSEEAEATALKLVRSLIDQDNPAALRDAIRTSAMLHLHAPDDAEPPLLAARARARWVKLKLEELRTNVSETERAELSSAIANGKTWLEKAARLKAKKKNYDQAEAELAEAEEILAGTP